MFLKFYIAKSKVVFIIQAYVSSAKSAAIVQNSKEAFIKDLEEFSLMLYHPAFPLSDDSRPCGFCS